MPDSLTLDVIRSAVLAGSERSEILALCSRAHGMDYEPLYRTFLDATHVLARWHGTLVSHALWVTRWLQCGALPSLRTAYVEAVATEEAWRGRGFATAVMRRVAAEIGDFGLGGLSSAQPGLYARLGWELWRGPLFIRTRVKLQWRCSMSDLGPSGQLLGLESCIDLSFLINPLLE